MRRRIADSRPGRRPRPLKGRISLGTAGRRLATAATARSCSARSRSLSARLRQPTRMSRRSRGRASADVCRFSARTDQIGAPISSMSMKPPFVLADSRPHNRLTRRSRSWPSRSPFRGARTAGEGVDQRLGPPSVTAPPDSSRESRSPCRCRADRGRADEPGAAEEEDPHRASTGSARGVIRRPSAVMIAN
jgi:hypothetical protein